MPAESGFRVTTVNVDRPGVAIIGPLDSKVWGRRTELAAQGCVLPELGRSIAGGTPLQLQVKCFGGRQGAAGLLVDGIEVSALRESGVCMGQHEVLSGSILALETQALADCLALHMSTLFRAGERAMSHLYYEDSQSLPPPAVFEFTMPECDLSVGVTHPTILARAGAVISEMIQATEEVEQRGFAVGVLGPGSVAVVTDVVVPPHEAEGAGQATVQFSAEDWMYAEDIVAGLGEPFRILGTCHTHPHGAITPSAFDWDVFTWAAGAEGLHLIGGNVGGRASVGGFQWVQGSLEQVKIEIERAGLQEPVAHEEQEEAMATWHA